MGNIKKFIKTVLAILNTIFASLYGLSSLWFQRNAFFAVVIALMWIFVVWWWALNERKVQVALSTSQVPITSPARKIFDFKNVLDMLMYFAALLVMSLLAAPFVALFITFN